MLKITAFFAKTNLAFVKGLRRSGILLVAWRYKTNYQTVENIIACRCFINKLVQHQFEFLSRMPVPIIIGRVIQAGMHRKHK